MGRTYVAGVCVNNLDYNCKSGFGIDRRMHVFLVKRTFFECLTI